MVLLRPGLLLEVGREHFVITTGMHIDIEGIMPGELLIVVHTEHDTQGTALRLDTGQLVYISTCEFNYMDHDAVYFEVVK